MYYKLVIYLNNYIIEKTISFKNNMSITNISNNNISDIIYSSNSNNIRLNLFKENDLILDTDNILVPKKLYKMYDLGYKKLYSFCLEFDEYLICIDIIKIYKMKYFKSIFIAKII